MCRGCDEALERYDREVTPALERCDRVMKPALERLNEEIAKCEDKKVK